MPLNKETKPKMLEGMRNEDYVESRRRHEDERKRIKKKLVEKKMKMIICLLI